MNKLTRTLAALAVILCAPTVTMQAQQEAGVISQRHRPQPENRPSTYELVNELRDSVGLTSKEFEKIYAAYEKYDKNVYGNSDTQPSRGGIGHPPMGGGPSHGGPGGPGGGMPGGGGDFGHHGDGRPDGMPGGASEFGGQNRKAVDIEKLEKEKIKQEEKLGKTVKKLFKNEPEKYMKWLEIRDRQLKRMQPSGAHRPGAHPEAMPPRETDGDKL